MMKAFVQELIQPADIDGGAARIGLLTFSFGSSVHFHMIRHFSKADVIEAISNIPYRVGSGRNVARALEIVRKSMFSIANGERSYVPNVVVFITDGMSTINSEETIPQAVLAKNEGITIYSIGVGLDKTEQIDAIASKPLSRYRYNVQYFTSLFSLTKLLVDSIYLGKFLCFVEIFHSIYPDNALASLL